MGIFIGIWIVIGLILAIIGIWQAGKDGVAEDKYDIGFIHNEIINFIVVGIMLLSFAVLGPLALLFCLRKKNE